MYRLSASYLMRLRPFAPLRCSSLPQSNPCSTKTTASIVVATQKFHRQSGNNSYGREKNNKYSRKKFRFHKHATKFMLAGIMPYWVWLANLIPDDLGLTRTPLVGETDMESNIKKSWAYRKNGKYKEAEKLLHNAVEEATNRNDELGVTRAYQELANLYLELDDLKRAEELYKTCLNRYINIHLAGKSEAAKFKARGVIAISLRLSQVYARMKEFEKAEVGFQLCLDRQGEVVQEEIVEKGKKGTRHMIESQNFTQQERDNVALYGMILEAYAHFLLTQPARPTAEGSAENKNSPEEAIIVMIRCQNLLSDLFGPYHSHTITVLNNFAMECLSHDRTKAAVQFMKSVVRKAVQNDDVVNLLPGYYANYAETLFHAGNKEEAVEKAKTAVKLAQELKDESLVRHCKAMLTELQKAVNGAWW